MWEYGGECVNKTECVHQLKKKENENEDSDSGNGSGINVDSANLNNRSLYNCPTVDQQQFNR